MTVINVHFGLDADSFDLHELRWEQECSTEGSMPPSGRCFHSASVIDDAMFIFGGTLEFAHNIRSSEMFRFQFDTTPRCTLLHDFLDLLQHDEDYDLTLVLESGSQRIGAHASIVAARSPFLRSLIITARDSAQLQSEAGASKRPEHLSVQVELLDASTCHALLYFMYTDRLVPQCTKEPLDDKAIDLLFRVYQGALHLKLVKLQRQCVFCIRNSISIANVIPALQAACGDTSGPLKEYLLSFCVKDSNFKRIIMLPEFESLNPNIIVQLIRKRETSAAQRVELQVPSEFEALDANTGDLHSDMLTFLQGSTGRLLADVEFLVDGERLPGHRAVLSARGSYFQALFRSGMRETVTCELGAAIGDVIPTCQAFKSLLRYIYAGDIRMPAEDAMYLFSASQYYGFRNSRLQMICKKNLELNVTSRNVLEVFEAADRIQAVEMKQHAADVIVQNFVKIAKHPKLRLLSKELLLEILDALAVHTERLQRLQRSPAVDTLSSSSA